MIEMKILMGMEVEDGFFVKIVGIKKSIINIVCSK